MFEKDCKKVYYDTAQICINGDLINKHVKASPSLNKNFCDVCGAKVISECPECQSPIKGCHHIEIHLKDSINWETNEIIPEIETHCQQHEYVIPSYCDNCGAPYPWIQQRLDYAKELIAEMNELTSEEQEKFNNSLPKILIETPQTPLAANRIHTYLAKIKPIGKEAIKQLFFDVTIEAAKKMIWP